MLPSFQAVIDLPDVLDTSRDVLRAYTRSAKTALREYLIHHHKRVIPRHFVQTNRGRYQHFPRTAATKARKARQYRSRTDLVKTRRSKNSFRAKYKRIRAGGKFGDSDNNISATLEYRFPFPVSASSASKERAGTVNPFKMALEIEAWTADEVAAANKMIGQRIIELLREEIKTRPRVKRKIGGKL